MRWIEVMEPDYVILEQVPAAEYIWEDLAAELYADGWAVADVRVVDAADYGVPQHRRRAVLTAARYDYGSHLDPGPLWGSRGPYVTPADVLGLDGVLGFARRNDRPDGAAYRVRDMRPTSRPAFTLTEKVRSWTYAPADGSLARQLTAPEVSALMSFPPDYPWAGSRSRACLQAANAVPPLMAAHLLAGLLGLPAPALARPVGTAAADLAA